MPTYLNDNPLRYLLDHSSPEVRYLALRDLMPGEIELSLIDDAYNNLHLSERIRFLVSTAHDGIMGDREHFDILYRGSMWYFAEAAARGLDARDDTLRRSADYLLAHCQVETGGITLNWKPRLAVACRTGDLMRWMMHAGIHDERIDRGVMWMIRNQRHDGGWLHCPLAGALDMASLIFLRRSSGSGLSRENDPETASCIRATASCFAALLEWQKTHRNDSTDACIGRAAEFFLRQRFFIDEGRYEEPVCCGRRGAEYQHYGYPVMSHYDALFGLMLAARAGCANDARTGTAFNHMISSQNADGTWDMKAFGAGMLYEKKNKVGLDARGFMTLNALKTMKYCGIAEWKTPA